MTGDSTTTHPDTATLSAYHDGELRGFARAEVEKHLPECARCRRELSEIEALSTALRALPVLEPPESVHEAVRARVAGTRPRRRQPRRLVWGIAAAIAALVGIIGGYDFFAMPHGGLAPAAIRATKTLAPFAQSNGATFAPGKSFSAVAPQSQASSGAASGPNAIQPQMHAAVRSGASQVAPSPPPGTVDARLIARSGEVDLRVRDVAGAFKVVESLATHQHGYVSDSNNSVSSSGGAGATLTLRVPAANFQATVDALAALPHTALTTRSNSTDVTDSYHDLQAQAQALEATRTQLIALMRKARNVGEAMSVLDRLTDVNTQIDSVQSQIMSSANSVMLATITVNLTPEPKRQVVAPPLRRPSNWQPGRTLGHAISNVIAAIEVILTVSIYVAIYLALPALLAAMILLARRLRRQAPRRV